MSILRDGAYIGTLEKAFVTEEKIIQMMVGRKLENIFEKKEAFIGRVVLEVKNLSSNNFLQDIDFKVHKGEILGFAGLVGAGRTEVMRALFGIDPKDSGEVYIDGKKVEINSAYDAIKHGISFVPEDRKNQALLLGMNCRENITLPLLKKISKMDFINTKIEKDICFEYIEKLNIKTPSPEQKVINLSGGNQQKIILSRCLAINPKVLILDEPTRGIDVGAKKEIHSLISDLAGQGLAIILISSEMPEILGMSDRIVIMNEGVIKGELSRSEASQEKIMEIAITKMKEVKENV